MSDQIKQANATLQALIDGLPVGHAPAKFIPMHEYTGAKSYDIGRIDITSVGPILVLDDELDDEMKRIDAVTKPIIRSMIDHVHRTGVMPALVADGQVIAPARRVYREVYRWNPRLGGWVYKGVRRG